MTPLTFLNTAYRPAMAILPPHMNTPAACAQILAIALQESNLEARRQRGGPARSYTQFELGGGVTEVLTNINTRVHARAVLDALDYSILTTPADMYVIIEHNDVTCAAFSRLLLWTIKTPIPAAGQPHAAWQQYIDAWRPGKPHRETWDQYYYRAWDTVHGKAPLT